jgi:hypothetical protein
MSAPVVRNFNIAGPSRKVLGRNGVLRRRWGWRSFRTCAWGCSRGRRCRRRIRGRSPFTRRHRRGWDVTHCLACLRCSNRTRRSRCCRSSGFHCSRCLGCGKSATSNGASTPRGDNRGHGRSSQSNTLPDLRCHSNEVPATHPQSSRCDRPRHLGDHPRCKRKKKHRHQSGKNLSDGLIGRVTVHRRDPIVRDCLEDPQHEVDQHQSHARADGQ